MKRHACVAVVAETEEVFDPAISDNWVIVSATYECAICGKPMDAPNVASQLVQLLLKL